MRPYTLTHGFARVRLAHTPTPLEHLASVSESLGGPEIWVKRDDCTGLAMGGNKARQLEYYMGAAVAAQADTVLITSAVQSNFMRMTAAAAAKLGLKCILQTESRVEGMSGSYKVSGNVLLDRIFGAEIRPFPDEGVDDEALTDGALDEQADVLREQGFNPFVIHLGAAHPPIGALGYVDAGIELAGQARAEGLHFDAVVVPSGSALTHVGLLMGLRMESISAPVKGICVRRDRSAQEDRVWKRLKDLEQMLNRPGFVSRAQVRCCDEALGAGYGKMGSDTIEAIELAARHEGLLLDPVYTGKTFGYQEVLDAALDQRGPTG